MNTIKSDTRQDNCRNLKACAEVDRPPRILVVRKSSTAACYCAANKTIGSSVGGITRCRWWLISYQAI